MLLPIIYNKSLTYLKFLHLLVKAMEVLTILNKIPPSYAIVEQNYILKEITMWIISAVYLFINHIIIYRCILNIRQP